MKKRNCRAQKVNEIRWEAMADRVKERAVVWAIDVAKVLQRLPASNDAVFQELPHRSE